MNHVKTLDTKAVFPSDRGSSGGSRRRSSSRHRREARHRWGWGWQQEVSCISCLPVICCRREQSLGSAGDHQRHVAQERRARGTRGHVSSSLHGGAPASRHVSSSDSEAETRGGAEARHRGGQDKVSYAEYKRRHRHRHRDIARTQLLPSHTLNHVSISAAPNLQLQNATHIYAQMTVSNMKCVSINWFVTEILQLSVDGWVQECLQQPGPRQTQPGVQPHLAAAAPLARAHLPVHRLRPRPHCRQAAARPRRQRQDQGQGREPGLGALRQPAAAEVLLSRGQCREFRWTFYVISSLVLP